jgi:hypothetical protein
MQPPSPDRFAQEQSRAAALEIKGGIIALHLVDAMEQDMSDTLLAFSDGCFNSYYFL